MKQSSIQIYKDMPNGFHLHSAELVQADPDRLLHGSDEWEVLAGVLLSCQSGNLAPLALIPELLRKHDGFQFWKAATELLGYAASWRLIEDFFAGFQEELDDRGVQFFMAISLANSCGLWAVEPLLTLHAKAVEEDPRYQIQRHLSYLLEEENGTIWVGAEEKVVIVDPEDIEVRTDVDFEGYARVVRAARDAIAGGAGSGDRPVYEGRVLDIAATARILYERLTTKDDSKDRIFREQMLFEASTGEDCSGFFDKENALQYLAAAAIMETFLESDSVGRFQPGRRYFFGHPIPD